MLLWQQALLNSTIVPGTRPSFVGIQTLFPFDGSSSNSGIWASGMTTRGTITYDSDAPFGSGQSGEFNGASGLYNANGPISGTGPYSVACWVKFNSPMQTSYLIAQRDAQNTGQFSLIVGPTGWAHSEGNSATVNSISYTSVVPTPGVWYHYAYVRNGTSHKLFLDGEQVAALTRNPANIVSSNGLSIGFDQRDVRYFLNGKMKDVVVATRALSADEILWMAKSNQNFPTS